MNQALIIKEVFADNGAYSHSELISTKTGKTLWRGNDDDAALTHEKAEDYMPESEEEILMRDLWSIFNSALGGDTEIMLSSNQQDLIVEMLQKASKRGAGPFTKQEQIVSMLLTNAHNAFMVLDHSQQTKQEWISAFHHLQDILHQRILHRDYPFVFCKP